ncbi:MAG: hypothetical protein HY869_24190 [Chloroflexi bacterium]|nr:hypothetical protein [Chloroflexota bacterium]
MRNLFFIVLAVALAACALNAQKDLTANQQKWETSGVTHYRYDLFIGCFCAFTEQMPLSIEVLDGEVVSMTYADGTPIAADDPLMELFDHFSTFDHLFADLQTGPASKADEVTVEYQPTYGFPVTINIDQVKEAVDDEYYLTISNFEILK